MPSADSVTLTKDPRKLQSEVFFMWDSHVCASVYFIEVQSSGSILRVDNSSKTTYRVYFVCASVYFIEVRFYWWITPTWPPEGPLIKLFRVVRATESASLHSFWISIVLEPRENWACEKIMHFSFRAMTGLFTSHRTAFVLRTGRTLNLILFETNISIFIALFTVLFFPTDLPVLVFFL